MRHVVTVVLLVTACGGGAASSSPTGDSSQTGEPATPGEQISSSSPLNAPSATPGQTPGIAWRQPIEGEAIAFISEWDVHALEPSSSIESVLTSPRDIETGPAWSADGTELAYAIEGSPNLFFNDSEGGERQVLKTGMRGDGSAPSWSPDGTHIAFGLYRADGASIYVVDRNGSTPTLLLERTGSYPCCVDWSPDGTTIAFIEGSSDAETDIYVMAADGSEVTQLTDEPGVDSAPRWSPDGSQLAFFSDRDGGGVFVMKPDGSEIEKIVGNTLEARVGWVDWAPDGQSLAFIGEFAGEGNLGSPLYVFELADPEFRQLTETNATGSPISWRNDS